MTGKQIIRSVIAISSVVLFVTAFSGTQQFAEAQVQTGNQAQFQSQSITGDALKNNPMAQKILLEIEYSKKQIAQLQKNQKDAEENKKLIDQQKLIAAQLEKQAQQLMDLNNLPHTPTVAFRSFVSTVNNTKIQNIFWGEFNFTSKRVDAGNAAMKKVLDSGGTWEEAMQEFTKYAAIRHSEIVELNKNLNIQYGLADFNVQKDFNEKGMLPDNYIKVPSSVYSHA
ncbi:hypothetical protein HY212_01485 [Candidatus Pacearchaeota archaeon]|nr:hypothetical protein [Candidatus Pacearchaeota archaeon]